MAAAVIPVLVGSALAWRTGAFAATPALLCLVFALLVQIGTNFANDYGDFVKGADTPDRLGPRRAVASGEIAPRMMAIAAAATFTIAFCAGLGLVWFRGWELLPIGVASLLFGWAYTSGPYPLAYYGLGDVFVFLFFGLVAVGGTFYVQTGLVTSEALLAAVPVGLLATNILVVNNYRDAATDERANKCTLVVRFGCRFAIAQYAISFALALAIPALMAAMQRNWRLAAPVAFAPFAWGLTKRLRAAASGTALNALLADTAKFLLLYGVLWSAVLAWS